MILPLILDPDHDLMIPNKLVLRGHFMTYSLIWIQPGNDFGLLDGAKRGWNFIFTLVA